MAGLMTHWFSSPLRPQDVSSMSTSLNQIAQEPGPTHLLANFSGASYLSRILFLPAPSLSVTTVHP